MIALFTDFGANGPYVGQMHAVLHTTAPDVRVVDLLNEAPSHDPMASAYLLPALVRIFPTDTIFLCVVDPGVGSAREPIVVEADGRRFVGPDNGLFELVARRAQTVKAWRIDWRPARLSASFHGRDLFAPVAGQLANGAGPPGRMVAAATIRRPDWPDDLDRVIYIDRFGNAMTGRRAETLRSGTIISVSGRRLEQARTFSDRAPGEAFWYENANGLIEIAVNTGRADERLGLALGDPVRVPADN